MALRGNLGRLGAAALAVAGLAAGAAVVVAPAHAQAPQSVPVARFYGHATFPTGAVPPSTSITALVGSTACSVSVTVGGGNSTGQLDNLGNYDVDVQAVPGCTTPGATVAFTSGSLKAQQTGTLPQVAGTAVHLDLTFGAAATPTAAPSTAPAPPPPPSAPPSAATPRPSTAPPPPPPVTATPRPAASPTPARVQGPVSQQAPRGPVYGVAPKGPVAYQGPAKAYQAPAVAPRLPNTGTGGLLDDSSTGLTTWALAAIVLAALGVSASGLFAYRRSR